MAASSRWVARFSGFWTLQPNLIRTRHRCPGWMRRPVSRSSTAAILGSVQRSLVKPWVCAPSTRKRPKALRWDSLILGGCPRGRRFQAPLPLASRARRQRSAVGVETSHRRATSACVNPRANSPMPFFRRASMASRLRLVGRGFPIRELAETVARVIGYRGETHWDPTKPDGTPRNLMDSSRLRALGWQPQVPFEEGIAGAYRDFLSREQGA
jgi:hypothetical protein